MAQTSEVSICNQALGWLGANLITSFDDQTKEANLCGANYASLRDAVLERGDWTFAIRRAELPQLGEDELVPGYGNAYQLPSDCIRVIQASPDARYIDTSTMHWEAEDRKVLTDNGACFIKYVYREEDPVRFSPGFVQSLAYRIAAELAIPLTKSRQLQGQMLTIYEDRVKEATGMDGKQGRVPRARSSWSDKSRYMPGRGI